MRGLPCSLCHRDRSLFLWLVVTITHDLSTCANNSITNKTGSNQSTNNTNNTNSTNGSNLSAQWGGEAHLDAGLMLLADSQVEEAAVHFMRAVEVAPEGATSAYFHLGTALYHLNNQVEAAKHFHSATLVMPSHAESYLHLGVTLQEVDDDGSLGEIALQQLLHAAELSPKHAETYSYLGTALYTQNHTEEALGAFTTCMELDPTISTAHHNYGMIILDELSGMNAEYNSTSDEAELLRDRRIIRIIARDAQ